MNTYLPSQNDATELDQVTRYLRTMPIPACPLPIERLDTTTSARSRNKLSQNRMGDSRTRPFVVLTAIMLTGLVAVTFVIKRDSPAAHALQTEHSVSPSGLTARSPILVEVIPDDSPHNAGIQRIQLLRRALSSLRVEAERQRAARQLNQLRRRLNDDSLAAQ
ncbi:MAG: hypothetical protein KDA96_06200 [Planctomycetaceae bacterium]|nr:hypothetical protein [Planctomycetaceae bacterium]